MFRIILIHRTKNNTIDDYPEVWAAEKCYEIFKSPFSIVIHVATVLFSFTKIKFTQRFFFSELRNSSDPFC
jgi:hypothetical protein